MAGKVWLIGGTSDSKIIAEILMRADIHLVVSVTTETARTLYPAGTEVLVGTMELSAMKTFCVQNAIATVIDASHPYATAVSRQAIATATQLNLPYLRYERNNFKPDSTVDKRSEIIELDSFEDLLAGNYLRGQRVFLTVGCKILPQFQSWQSRATLYARVLPKVASLETALAAGFTSDRLIAMRPPISREMETALWQQWRISLVVTKASGAPGGEDVKYQVAANLGIPLIVVQRPQIRYPHQTSNLSEIVAFCL
ncbi:MAG: cobalt-precorrin-6A reductase [Cyanobacteria bacterium P01_A01_bin.83]